MVGELKGEGGEEEESNGPMRKMGPIFFSLLLRQ